VEWTSSTAISCFPVTSGEVTTWLIYIPAKFLYVFTRSYMRVEIETEISNPSLYSNHVILQQ